MKSTQTQQAIKPLAALTAGALCAAILAVNPADAQVLSSKRGFADTGANYTNLQATGAGWYYNWGTAPSNTGGFDATHRPMFWGWQSQGGIDYTLSLEPDYILGYNEPERSDQSNLTVAAAISNWTTISNATAAYNTAHGTSIKLTSPAVSDTSAGKAWMSDFMTQANNANLQVDAVAFHWYGASTPDNPSQAASNFIGSMNWYHQWNLPVFVTEFAIHDWGGNYPTADMIEANRQFLDIVVPWMESTSWVQGYAWYNWFSDSALYEGSPSQPTQMAYEYTGVVRNGETYDPSGIDHGEHVAFLAGGHLTHDGSGGSLRYVHALEGANTIGGSTDWSLNGWARIESGASLRKTGTDQLTLNGGSIENHGTFEVAQGTLRLENNVSFPDGGYTVKSGATVTYHGVRDFTTLNMNYDVELDGGTVNTTTGMVGGIFIANGATLSGQGTVAAQSVTAQSGSTIQIGQAGMPTNQPVLIDDFDSYNNSRTNSLGATPGNLTGDVWVGEFDGTGSAYVTDDPDGDQSLAVREGSGWRGAETDLANNFATDVSLADGDTATYFYQVMAEGTATDCMVGLAENRDAVDINNSWQDFSVMPYVSGGNLKVYGDNIGDQAVTAMTTGQWYNVWVVVDNAAKQFDMYYSTGLNDGTLAYANVDFGRVTSPANLQAFAIMNNGTDLVHLDNLYMTPGENTSNPLAGGTALAYSPQVMTVDSDLTLLAGSAVVLDIATDGVNDLLNVTGSLTAGGTLDVILDASAPALSLGDSFDLLDFASASGAFDTLNLPTLGSGLFWDTSNLLTTGVIEVVDSLGIPGDLNGDGYVGLDDLQPILDHWNQTVTVGDAAMGDISGPGGVPDGYVGLDDLQPVLDHWNEGTLPTPGLPGANIPEPSTFALLGLWGTFLCHARPGRKRPHHA